TGGTVTTDIGGGDDVARALAVQADGKLVAAGVAPTATGSDFALARYNPNGTLDASFGAGGTVTTDLIGGANALVVQADGKLVAAGVAGQDFGLARYNPNGTLDASFGAGGTVTTDIAGDSDAAQALAVQADGKLVAAGGAGPGGDFALARYRTR
ncbi:MAG TPA: delta-60 repeat domain-containing protein, partial [Actinomycetota bacterium]|nr:delta-60 repeat domain-containing protein [Actinomycetota bacterium]